MLYILQDAKITTERNVTSCNSLQVILKRRKETGSSVIVCIPLKRLGDEIFLLKTGAAGSCFIAVVSDLAACGINLEKMLHTAA